LPLGETPPIEKNRAAMKPISPAVSAWFALAALAISTLRADPINVPNAGFEERESFDPFTESTDRYPQWGLETWRQFEIADNGGPLRIWNPGIPGIDDTSQGVVDVAFGGVAPEGKYVMLVRSRQNDPARTFEAAVQILEEPFDSGQAYTLTAKVGRLPEADMGGSVNYDPDWFGYAVQFVVGGENIDGARFAGQVVGGTVLAEDHDSIPVPMDEFITSTVIYRPNPDHAIHDGEPIQIRLCALETPENPEDDSLAGWVAFDDVTLETGAIAPPRFAITSIAFDPSNREVTLTWDSREGQSYAVRYSEDLIEWGGDLDDGVDGDEGESTTRTFDVGDLVQNSPTLFFRVDRN
jgi:hypothetical protein